MCVCVCVMREDECICVIRVSVLDLCIYVCVCVRALVGVALHHCNFRTRGPIFLKRLTYTTSLCGTPEARLSNLTDCGTSRCLYVNRHQQLLV